MSDTENFKPRALTVTYRNWRGKVAVRRLEPVRVWHGKTVYHPTTQWLLTAKDMERGELRDFAIADILAIGELYQPRVHRWMLECFGEAIAADGVERNYRFLEEALELVQALGCSRDDAIRLVDYVYGRPAGEPRQEVGGVMVTLAALCNAHGIDMQDAGEAELARVWTKIETIRAKQAAKPIRGPLPGPSPEETDNGR